ncbi:aminotransferase class I/II-fold pyridoxal phosphate-dependent enzyme, partial [Stenotrophomonas maltophilia]|uniref:aminotransferase class I/II-fold pyridoxal phosphate-dependent enzyme n=1 Tax=Stenotrophomonas maltophilia TaxID=40324 RepID=UPI000D67E802
MQPNTKLPKVGTTIFTVMSQLAAEHGAVNLGQGFPDFSAPQRLIDETARAMAAGLNQYPPMTGVAPLRQAIAQKALDCYGAQVDADSEITVTSGGDAGNFNPHHRGVRARG